jgi:hypothetical protein
VTLQDVWPLQDTQSAVAPMAVAAGQRSPFDPGCTVLRLGLGPPLGPPAFRVERLTPPPLFAATPHGPPRAASQPAGGALSGGWRLSTTPQGGQAQGAAVSPTPPPVAASLPDGAGCTAPMFAETQILVEYGGGGGVGGTFLSPPPPPSRCGAAGSMAPPLGPARAGELERLDARAGAEGGRRAGQA